ncbi:MAG: T9SS type A sorting domain-containing protein, partial [Bacteroidia bacterium]
RTMQDSYMGTPFYTYTDTGYLWVSPAVKIPLLSLYKLTANGQPLFSGGSYTEGFTVSVDEQLAERIELKIYPNPAKESASLSLRLQESSQISAEIVNVMGQTVRDITNEQGISGEFTQSFSVAGLPTGLYWVKLRINEAETFQKMWIE